MPPRQPAPAVATAITMRPATLQANLQLATAAAATRASEAQQLYSSVAEMLDAHRHGEPAKALPTHMKTAFKAFCDDISVVAQRHFESYIRGSPRPPAPYMVNIDTPKTPPDSAPSLPSKPPSRSRSQSRSRSHSLPTSQPSSYAQAAAKPPTYPATTPPTASASSVLSQRVQKKKPLPPDSRLFVRLPANHQARPFPGYAILTKLRVSLGDAGHYLREVQTVKTGFALCPTSSSDLPALEACIPAITSFFGKDSHVEKAPNWMSYRITNVPRSITVIGDHAEITTSLITPEILLSALAEATRATPAAASQTASSAASPHDYSSSWIVRFPSDISSLPRSLLLFGARTTMRLLPAKTTTIQCSRCFQWHNERSCARPARCRLCGSTEHSEADHPICSSTPHDCPPRCLHCHGPHAADSLECLLRPRPNAPPLSKTQKSQIRQTCAEASLRIRSSAGCSLKTATATETAIAIATDSMDHTHSDTTDPPITQPLNRPQTPPIAPPPAVPPVTDKAVRFSSPTTIIVRPSSFSRLPYEL
jgi:hypothetical protein